MDDVAQAVGVSQMTVSRAFDDTASIKQETRDRILKVASQIGYYPNRAASSLASQRTRSFGIVLPTLQDSIYLPFVEGARRVFEANQSDYLLQAIDYAKVREASAVASLLAHRVQVVLLPSIGHTAQSRKFLKNIPIPMIEVGNLPARPIDYAVGHSDHEAGYMATRHLLDIGRRRIAIMCGKMKNTTNARDRFAGYRKAIREAGLSVGERRVAEVEHAVDAGLEGIEWLLKHNRNLDGLVVAGEIWSAATLLHLVKSGKEVPREIAVVGIGKVDIGAYLPVPLAYVDLPRCETGSRSAELAIALSQGQHVRKRVIRLGVQLVVNASARPLPRSER